MERPSKSTTMNRTDCEVKCINYHAHTSTTNASGSVQRHCSVRTSEWSHTKSAGKINRVRNKIDFCSACPVPNNLQLPPPSSIESHYHASDHTRVHPNCTAVIDHNPATVTATCKQHLNVSSLPFGSVNRHKNHHHHHHRHHLRHIATILLTCCLFTAVCIQPSFGRGGSSSENAAQRQPHHSSHYHSKHKSSILSSLMTFNELITAESIYPCLDTFDVILMRSSDGQPQTDQPKVKDDLVVAEEDSHNNNNNQTRQLVRVYWATKDVVDRIVSATAQHMSTDRLYPSHHHYQHQHHHHGHQQHHQWKHHHNGHHLHAQRPSMLIELRQLNYVREYMLPLKSQLVRMRCDIFEPKESIYYCFIYVILHRHAVRFESLPYCVPTTLTDQPEVASDKINEINQRPIAAYPKLIGPNNSDGLIADMDILGGKANESTRKYLNDDHGQMNREHERMSPFSKMNANIPPNGQARGELEQIRSMILPPGPAYGRSSKEANPLLESDYVDPISEPENGQPMDSTEKDANIRQFALKSADQSDYDVDRKRSSAARRRKKVLIQTRSCYCASSQPVHSSLTPSKADSLQHSLVRINLTTSETIVLHLIITSCPAATDELSDDSREMYANYSDSNETLHYTADDNSEVLNATNHSATDSAKSDNTEDGFDSSKTDKKSPNKQKNVKLSKQQPTKKRKKGKKTKGKVKEKEVTETSTEQAQQSSTWSTSSTSSPSSSTSSTSTSSAESSTSPPTVCILSIDNPSEYSFKLDSIEPSMEWPVSDHQFGGIDFSSTIDLIDYLHKFPFLVVRNGQLSIDPQMNIENRSQTHYLRSGHLRFEALSSINVTLRFRRSASAVREHHHRLLHKPNGDNDQWSVVDTVHSLMDRTISYIAHQVFSYNQQDGSAQSHLTPFHITSMLLSLFIVTTLIIYAVIAVRGHDTSQRSRVVQIRTPEEINELENSADCSLMAPSGSGRTEEAATNGQRHDSLGSFCLEQQSLEIDYYDYAQPLMAHSASGSFATKVETSIGEANIKCQSVNPAESSNAAQLGATSNNTSSSSYRRSLEVQQQQSAVFRTLPIKVNSPNRKISSSTANTSMSSLTVNGAQSTAASNHLINDHSQSKVALQPGNSSSSVATLTRLSFTKPPVLLSTFGRQE